MSQQGPSKIELTVCTGCEYRKQVGTMQLSDFAVTAEYGCTHLEVIAHTMPLYSFKVFGAEPEAWVQFVQLDKIGRYPVPCGACPFVSPT